MFKNKVFSHEISSRDENEGFARLMLRDSDVVKPILKERFLRDYIFGADDSYESFKLYCDAFGIKSGMPVRTAVFSGGEALSQERKQRIRNNAERCFADSEIILSTVVMGNVLLILKDIPDKEIRDCLLKVAAGEETADGLLVVYSATIPIADIPGAFRRLSKCLEYSFYTDGFGVMCENEIKTGVESGVLVPKYTGIERAVLSGDEKKTKTLLTAFYNELEKWLPPPAVAKTYCLELYVCIIRCCEAEQIDSYMKGLVSIQNGKNIREIKSFISEKALEIVRANSPKEAKIFSSLVKDTLRIINDNISNEKLSLRWIAKNHLFTNVDYLGKVFKKEVGKNFSHYVMEKRMELAKQLILSGKKDRIYEVAERVGYGTNSQYFSQVFKKYTGSSPLEYKESVRLASNK